MKQPGFHLKEAYCYLLLPFFYAIHVEIRKENWTFYHQVTPLVNLMMSRQNWIKTLTMPCPLKFGQNAVKRHKNVTIDNGNISSL